MVQRGLSMPAEVWDWFDAEAERMGLRGTQLMRAALVAWMRDRRAWDESAVAGPEP